MKKVIASAAGILFAVFGIAILGLLMSLTFGALGKLFPGNFTNQLWGLVLFDIAAIIWAVVFVYKSESTGQYATAAIGFIASFVGTLGMVAVEVMLSGQTFVEVEEWVGQWLVYGFVIMTAIHSSLLYGHHATAPEIHEKINVGIARGEITTEAIKQATQSLDVQKAILASSITQGIVEQVKRDLGLPSDQILDLPALPVTEPTVKQPAKDKPAFSLSQFLPVNWWAKKNGSQIYEQTIPAPITQNATLQNDLVSIRVPQDVYQDLVEKYPRHEAGKPTSAGGDGEDWMKDLKPSLRNSIIPWHCKTCDNWYVSDNCPNCGELAPELKGQAKPEPTAEEGNQAHAPAPFRGDGISE